MLPENRVALKLTELWEHLPVATQCDALSVAIRMLAGHVKPAESEVKHDAT
jgi:hypothetical protein